jgi:hypothetical protein
MMRPSFRERDEKAQACGDDSDDAMLGVLHLRCP